MALCVIVKKITSSYTTTLFYTLRVVAVATWKMPPGLNAHIVIDWNTLKGSYNRRNIHILPLVPIPEDISKCACLHTILSLGYRFRWLCLFRYATIFKGFHLSNLGLTQYTIMIGLLAVVQNKRNPTNRPKHKDHDPWSSPSLPGRVSGDARAGFLMTVGALFDKHRNSCQCRVGLLKGCRWIHRGWCCFEWRMILSLIFILLLLRHDFGNRGRYRNGTWLHGGVCARCIYVESNQWGKRESLTSRSHAFRIRQSWTRTFLVGTWAKETHGWLFCNGDKGERLSLKKLLLIWYECNTISLFAICLLRL